MMRMTVYTLEYFIEIWFGSLGGKELSSFANLIKVFSECYDLNYGEK